MSESLEAQLTDSDISGNSQDIEGFKISDLIRELNLALKLTLLAVIGIIYIMYILR